MWIEWNANVVASTIYHPIFIFSFHFIWSTGRCLTMPSILGYTKVFGCRRRHIFAATIRWVCNIRNPFVGAKFVAWLGTRRSIQFSIVSLCGIFVLSTHRSLWKIDCYVWQRKIRSLSIFSIKPNTVRAVHKLCERWKDQRKTKKQKKSTRKYLI